MSEEFKLNLYFNMYKDTAIGSRDSFRRNFVKKHGRYHYLPELILMIERYQMSKYNTTLWNNCWFAPSNKKKRRR